MVQVVVISLSGVMAPGPLTAAAIATGSRNRYAGLILALGHGIIEFPLMILIILGMGRIFESAKTQIVIGLAGGTFLLLMAGQMLISLKTTENPQSQVRKQKPILTGLILSAGNPYFLLWWATVGLTLATGAAQLGIWAFALFAIVHWLCDCIWLQTLSWASFKGAKMFGGKSQRIVLMICSAALLFFGLFFIYNAAANLIKMN